MITNMLKSDLYRIGKSKLFYGLIAFTCIIAFSLTLLIHQNIRIGISVFGDLTAFKNIDDIVGIGIKYQKGLGIFVAILISVFIGQEYQWQTWQHKWITSKSRTFIYLSKMVLCSTAAAAMFLIFQIVVLVSYGHIQQLLTREYAAAILCGIFIYAALGSIVCMLSMLIKNSAASIIVCLSYVLFSETWISVIKNAIHLSDMAARLINFGIKHSIYGMTTIVSSTPISIYQSISFLINSLVLILLSTTIGLVAFRKYEL